MLEMLSPSGADVLRFATTVIKVRQTVHRAAKQSPQAMQAAAVQAFCSPPVSARRTPDLARLRDDTRRYFGWSSAQWRAHEAPLRQLLDSAHRSRLAHDGLQVQCYSWQPTHAGVATRGRLLLCHGWEGYALNFALLIEQALQAGYEVHAFDHLAHGASQGTLSGLPIALDTLLAVARHVQATAGPIHALVGHSLGGAAASWAVAHRRIAVQRLVLLAPFYDTRKLSGLWAKAHLLSDEVRAALQAGLEDASGKRFSDFLPDALVAQFNQAPHTPVLIVHDPDDKITAFKHSAEMAAKGTHIKLHPAHQLGHLGILADGACTGHALQFIQH